MCELVLQWVGKAECRWIFLDDARECLSRDIGTGSARAEVVSAFDEDVAVLDWLRMTVIFVYTLWLISLSNALTVITGDGTT